jgi:hypothetical protein
LQPILTRAINWDLIRQQYDQMVKYATALRLGMAETEAILKRFTRGNLLHPTYQALAELGKAVKTIFLCKYLCVYIAIIASGKWAIFLPLLIFCAIDLLQIPNKIDDKAKPPNSKFGGFMSCI